MANNKTVNGVTVATDEIAGVDYQRMKIIDGTEDGITGAIVSGTGGLRVDLATALDRNVDTVGQGLFNGASSDLARGNYEQAILGVASRTTTQRVQDLVNTNARGVVIRVKVTVAGTGSITVSVWGQDINGTDFWVLGQTAAITTVSFNIIKVYPGITPATNLAFADVLPRLWMVQVAHNNANPITYAVDASLIV